MYYLLRLATLVLPRFPAWLRAWLGIGIGTLAWCIAGKARRQANANIQHVLGPECEQTRQGRSKRRRIVRQMFQHNVRNYLEVCVLPHYTQSSFQRIADEHGFEHLDAALAQGKGVIAFTAHYGPFDVITQAGSYRGYDITIPVEALKEQRMLDLMLHLRSSKGIQFVSLGEPSTLRTIIHKLKSNNVVVLTADRGSQGQKSSVPFFGVPAELPNGVVTLAQRTGATIIGAFAIRTSLTRIRLECVPVTLEMTAEQRQDPTQILHKISEVMERFIRAHPEQWLAFTPIWSDPPAPT